MENKLIADRLNLSIQNRNFMNSVASIAVSSYSVHGVIFRMLSIIKKECNAVLEQQKYRKNWAVPVLVMVCLLCMVMMASALVYTQIPAQGEFTPSPFEETEVSGTSDVPKESGWQELDAQAFWVSVCGGVVLEGNRADVRLTNPEDNTVWLKLRILDEAGKVLGETGLIRPGEYVQSVIFDTVPASGTEISMKVMAYEPETYHSGGAVTLNTIIQSGG